MNWPDSTLPDSYGTTRTSSLSRSVAIAICTP
jgi:hypothetical protein